MKFQFLRRTGALVLALVLALTLTVPAWAATAPAVTGVTLNKTTLTLTVGKSETLIATVTYDDGSNGNLVTWSSSNDDIATVSNGTVTAKTPGTVDIKATSTEDPSKTATCTVTVPTPGLKIEGAEQIIRDPGTLPLEATLTNAPEGAVMVEWDVRCTSPLRETQTPELTSTGATTATLDSTDTGPGDFTVTAACTIDGVEYTATKNVIISGIVITGPKLEEGGWHDHSIEMFVNESTALSAEVFGAADDQNATLAEWESSSPQTVSVPYNGGNLQAWQLGSVTIRATKGSYWDEVTVNVVEDTSVIAEPYSASVSNPLKFWDQDPNKDVGLFAQLNSISIEKTGAGLDYITNLSVPTRQGTLYYNYVAEGDTGNGVAITDQFARTASGRKQSLDRLYFVPKTGVTGTVDITFQGVSTNNQNFSGIIRVTVGTGTGAGGTGGEDLYQISYRARAGEPAWFMTSDFNAFSQSATGRSFGSVTFSLPKSSEGVLYYNYAGGTGTPVTTTTKFTPAGVYTLDNVCFVPNAAYADENTPIKISFQIVDSSGEIKSGEVEVSVILADLAGDPSNVMVSTEQGQPVTLHGELFNDACQGAIKDTLSFVVFKLPDPKEGVLYYNYQSNGSYESRVTASTRYYYSGVPGLSGVTFVPSSSATGRIAIPYTGYGSTGTSFSGTLYIGLDAVNSSTIRYSVEKNGMVNFRASDFYNAGLYQKGIGVDYVEIRQVSMSNPDLGKLRYDYRSSSNPGSVVSYGTYYVNPTYSWQSQLSLLSFHAAGLTGTVTIDYTAWCGIGTSQATSFQGQVIIQVGAIAAADVNVSCNTGGQAGLSSYSLSSVCSPVMSKSVSYIEITGVPASKEGHLYFNYSGFGTGTAVKPGDRFYRVGSPGIDRLTFVPYAGFVGTAEITYIGYSDDGLEQASGRVIVNVTQARTSRYFNDMSSYVWAIDSVDYLYQNGTVQGVGGNRYSPTGTITKGDFTLMLVRAYGLTASGNASFVDVPAGSYYADAIRIAALLGVASGSNGYYNPKAALSRQDAMLMIFNALKASGRVVTNGLAADLSVFYDEDDIAPYAKEAVGSLVQMGVVEGFGNGYLLPRRLLNRAETAKLLHAIMTL